MSRNIQLIVYPVKDINESKKFFNKFLKAEPYADSPYYVGYRIGDLEVGLDPNTDNGPIVYIDVDDVQSSIEEMTNAGGEVVQDVKEIANNLKIAQVKDLSGNVVGLRQQK